MNAPSHRTPTHKELEDALIEAYLQLRSLTEAGTPEREEANWRMRKLYAGTLAAYANRPQRGGDRPREEWKSIFGREALYG